MFTLITESCVMEPIVQQVDDAQALIIADRWASNAKPGDVCKAVFVQGQLSSMSYAPEYDDYDVSYVMRRI